MDIVLSARHCEVPDRFRRHVSEKLSKLERLDHRVIRIDVEVTREPNPRRADESHRLELTVRSKGPVIRAEAVAADGYAALDMAMDKLLARLRKAADRRRVHHGSRTPLSVAAATAGLAPGARQVRQRNGATRTPKVAGPLVVEPAGPSSDEQDITVEAGPMVVREKTHRAEPMRLDQALYEMELVGHDFYLFLDADSQMPSVVYRRRGYDYGVIHLDV